VPFLQQAAAKILFLTHHVTFWSQRNSSIRPAEGDGPMKLPHNERLQSLRGIAALMVMFGHASMLVPMSVNNWFPLQAVLFEANSAVVFFFVLSGFVLEQSFCRMFNDGRAYPLARYAVARIGRLLPVFWIAIIVGAAAHWLAAAVPLGGMGSWYYAVAGNSAPTIDGIAHNVVTFSKGYNGALWSVQVEFWMIVILPVMVFAGRFTSTWAALLIAIALCLLGRLMIWPALSGSDFAFVTYLYAFWLGLTLNKLVFAIGRHSRILCNGPLAAISFLMMLWLLRKTASGLDFGTKLICDGPLSVPIIAWASVEGRSIPARILTWRPLVWVGDVSYSFYAYGTPMLVIIAVFIVPLLPAWAVYTPWSATAITMICAAAATIVLLPLATLSYRFIERPGIRAAARISEIMISTAPMPRIEAAPTFTADIR
jgi:peptidoglycan/LPS O-acetylase OafA/YrhL